jgi:hypothetical protein
MNKIEIGFGLNRGSKIDGRESVWKAFGKRLEIRVGEKVRVRPMDGLGLVLTS